MSISRNTFDKIAHFVALRSQQGMLILDSDDNEREDIRKYELECFLKWFVGNGVPKDNNGFCIKSSSSGKNIVLTSKNETATRTSSVVVNRLHSTAADALGFGASNCSASRTGIFPAFLAGDKAEPFILKDGMTLAVSADGLPEIVVTFHTRDFEKIEQAKVTEVIAVISRALTNITVSF